MHVGREAVAAVAVIDRHGQGADVRDEEIEVPAADERGGAFGETAGDGVDEERGPAGERLLEFLRREHAAGGAFVMRRGLQGVVPFEQQEEVFQGLEAADVAAFDDALDAVADEAAFGEDFLASVDGVLPAFDGHLGQGGGAADQLLDGVDVGWGFGVEVGFRAGLGFVEGGLQFVAGGRGGGHG